VVFGALALWLLGGRESVPPPADSSRLEIRPITSSGLVIAAAISPDGKYVAYVESYQGSQSLHLQQMGTARVLDLVPPKPAAYWGLTFTPDSTEIVYAEKSGANPAGTFFRLAALGGTPRALVEGIDSAPTLSPDGSRMAWLRSRYPTEAESALMVAEADGSDVRTLATRGAPEALAPRFFVSPSWSPDGRLIAASVVSADTGRGWIVAFDARTGEERWASEALWTWASSVEWLPGGDGLLAVGQVEGQVHPQVWHLPYPTGEPRQITEGLQRYRLTSLTADGSVLVKVGQSLDATLSIRPRDGSGPPRRIPGTRMDGAFGFDLTRDGRIVHQTVEAGRL
jgi:Tol biopolymer transport system component